MKSIGFTGTRQPLTFEQGRSLAAVLIEEAGDKSDPTADDAEVHHGDCVGADATFHAMAKEQCLYIVVHPPDVDTLRARCDGNYIHAALPYLRRNQAIVNACNVLIACPSGPEEQRSGTWSTVRYARRMGVRVVIVWPSGEVTREEARK